MVEAAPAPEPSRFRRSMTRAVWPIAIAAPVAPVMISVLLRPPGSGHDADSFLFQLLATCAVMLLATLCTARLLEVQWVRVGVRDLSGQQSLAVLVLGLGAAWFCVGVAFFEGPLPGLVGQAIVHGLFAVLVAVLALVALTVRRLRAAGSDAD